MKNLTLEGQIGTKFEGKLQRCKAEAMEKQAKVRAAELKKRLKLEEKIKRELEKTQKAELKEKQKQEAKERKEAEKLEKKRAKEERERGKSRCPIFSFWRSSRASRDNV